MEVDPSEEDMMLQAIAMSLGQEVEVTLQSVLV